jgi:putative glutamine amidotransferase
MNLPVIGVTTSRLMTKYNFPSHSVAEKYVLALTEAGAAPLLIPLNQPADRLDAALSRLDGLLFTGGGDIHPRYFGTPLDGLEDTVDEDRDQVELYLFRQALAGRRPFLGICRGLQLVNVGLGGTLYTDILAQHPGAQRHAYFPEFPRDLLAHPVSENSGSQLHAILGMDQVEVNSLHHQGIKDLAPGLLETACAPDGIVEGVELPDYPFGLAVQWHPEWLQAHAPMRALFEAFVAACRSG